MNHLSGNETYQEIRAMEEAEEREIDLAIEAGERRLQRAIAIPTRTRKFEVKYTPYLLNDTPPVEKWFSSAHLTYRQAVDELARLERLYQTNYWMSAIYYDAKPIQMMDDLGRDKPLAQALYMEVV